MRPIIFVVLQLSQPRCIKRIESIRQNHFPIKVYGFDNGLYNTSLKTLPFRVDKLIIRKKEDSKLKKVLLFIKTIRQIKKESPRDAIYYFFSSELGTISYLMGFRNYIYEEGDINASKVNNKLLKRIFLLLEKRVVRNSKITVFTSEAFSSYLFKKDVPKNIVVLPNKLDPFFGEEEKRKVKPSIPDIHHLKIGFIGLIRYPNTIIRFAKVVGRHFPHHEFHFYGDVRRKELIDEELKSFNNVFFHGPFVNPNDLLDIYSCIDLSVVCYDTVFDNVRIAEPNKLYESIFFETPLVVSENTYLAKRVDSLGVGFCIDSSSDQRIKEFLDNLTTEELLTRTRNMQSTPISSIIDNPKALIERMAKL